MNRLIPYALFLTLAVSVFAITSGLKELEIGSKAPKPELKMKDISGKELALRDIMGKNGLVVIFSCNTCPYVVAWEDRYLKVAEASTKHGMGFILVNSNEAYRDGVDSMEEMKKHAEENNYSFPYVMDVNSELADAFGANRTPHVFLFDKDMILQYRGAIDDNFKHPEKVEEHYLLDAIEALAAGRDIAVKQTKSLGCTIKRKS